MTTNSVAAIVLAAGKGTRMRSNRAKVLHELGGEPMIARALRAVTAVEADPIVIVVGHQARDVEGAVTLPNARFAMQEPQRGTGDAVRCALGQLPANFAGDVL
ncbi:MAG TPA: NTP transferase domain-containing protein, partial [Candidatus Binatus sp.]|nr:NTP transferase domain-containing protein [Candidatus Binatus sp.]